MTMKIVNLHDRGHERLVAQISEQTSEFLKELQRILKSKGFVRTDARLQSALFHWTFTKDRRSLDLSGWHGTGKKGTSRWYGDLKCIHGLRDNLAYLGTDKHWKSDPVYEINVCDDSVEDHTKLLADTLAWAKTL